LKQAPVAQLVERVTGNDEVAGAIYGNVGESRLGL